MLAARKKTTRKNEKMTWPIPVATGAEQQVLRGEGCRSGVALIPPLPVIDSETDISGLPGRVSRDVHRFTHQ